RAETGRRDLLGRGRERGPGRLVGGASALLGGASLGQRTFGGGDLGGGDRAGAPRGELGGDGPGLPRLGVVPVLGRHVRVLRALAGRLGEYLLPLGRRRASGRFHQLGLRGCPPGDEGFGGGARGLGLGLCHPDRADRALDGLGLVIVCGDEVGEGLEGGAPPGALLDRGELGLGGSVGEVRRREGLVGGRGRVRGVGRLPGHGVEPLGGGEAGGAPAGRGAAVSGSSRSRAGSSAACRSAVSAAWARASSSRSRASASLAPSRARASSSSSAARTRSLAAASAASNRSYPKTPLSTAF